MVRLKYYFKRIKEANFNSILSVLHIRLKRKYYYVYYSTLYTLIFKPRLCKGNFEKVNSFSKDFKRSYLYNKRYLSRNIMNRKVLSQIEKGLFPCLGYGISNIPKGNEWNKDIFHDFQWKIEYFDSIDFVSFDKYCDVKVPWEYSRMQYFLFLALEYTVNEHHDAKIINQFNSILDNWLEYNPVGQGVNWICNMEVSIRVVNLIFAYLLLEDVLPSEKKKLIKISILEHEKYIETFPEVSDISGNHYLSNLMGSYVTSYFINGSNRSETLNKLKKFTAEAKNQFLPDGAHFEMATVYHRLCMDFVAIVLALDFRARGENYDQELLSIFENGVRFSESVSSNHVIVPFGDFDSGHVVWLGDEDRNGEYLSQFYSTLTKNYFCGEPKYKTLFFSSLAGLKPQKKEASNTSTASTYSRSGFLSSHLDSFLVVTRVGQQGLKGRASHDHDDALHTWLSFQGQDILIDEGSKPYSLDKEIRKNCIISSAHNVIKVVNKERFRPSLGSIVNTVRGASIASQYSHGVDKDACMLKASLNIHENSDFESVDRSIRTSKSKSEYLCEITDSWSLKEKDQIEVYWRFSAQQSPKIIKDKEQSKRISFDLDKFKVEVEFESPINFEFNIFEFDFSSRYGSKDKCYGARLIYDQSKQGEGITKVYVN